MFVAKKWRRLLEAARRDRNEARFFEDIRGALQERSLRPEDFRLREVFAEFVDDGHEIIQSWSPRSGGTRSGVMLSEAGVDTAAFANNRRFVRSIPHTEATKG